MPSYEEVTPRAGSLRAMTGLTDPAFSALLPHFEHACLAYMAHHTIDGQPRTSRRYGTYDTSPFAAMADKLLFILTSLKQNPVQEVQGQLFGMSQANAHQWMHLLHAGLHQALAQQDLLPARTADAFATQLTTKPSKERPTPPLFGLMVLSGPSTVRKTPRSRKHTPVASRKATRSKTSSGSMRPVTLAS
jgi:Helix-turn-helix of DDE superfamily endonuclease